MTFMPFRKVRRLTRRLQKLVMPQAVICMYHRIAEVDADPWGLCVTPAHFAEQLAVLRAYGQPMRLPDLVAALAAQRLPRRAVVVTFDDGYADNLYQARPLLEQYDIPATIFLTSGYLGYEGEFWWDELERLLLQPGTLPETLQLQTPERVYQWQLGAATRYSREEQQQDRSIKAWEAAPHSRLALYYELWQHLRWLPHQARQQQLDELATWAGASPQGRPTHRPLSWEEVHTLGQGSLCELGAHTRFHPFLSAHPLAVQQEEIAPGKAHLEAIVGRPVQSFAYPHGDYTAATRTLVQQAGFICACSTAAGSLGRRADPYQLPRCAVGNWDGEVFAKHLRSWFRR